MITRICKKCGGEYPETSEFFHKTPTGKKGLTGKCKKCIHEQSKINGRIKAKKRIAEYKPIESLKGEIWKDVKDYEGYYQVSNLGRVKSLSRKKGSVDKGFYISKEIIRKQIKDMAGYPRVELSKENNKKLWAVHRLVAIAFIPNPLNLPFVNHKDETRDNNNVNNLEWCTCEYNNNYGNRNKKQSLTKGKRVYQYTLEMKLVKKWISIAECGRNDFCHSSVRDCCRGKTKTNIYKGYIWSYTPLE